jgi:hypothetical protein
LIFDNRQKTVTCKHASDAETKAQINQNSNFWKPDANQNRQRQRRQQNITNSTYENLYEKKISRFGKPTQPKMGASKEMKLV